MAYEQKDFTGSLWKNDDKTEDTHADYKGSGKIDGKEYWLNAWINEAKDGRKYLSLKFKPKQARAEQPSQQGSGWGGSSASSITQQALNKVLEKRKPDPISSGRSLRDEMNDDIPFAPEWRG